MDNLDKLEDESIYIIREAYDHFRDVALVWSVGKDTTTLLWLIRKAFRGVIPFPVIHIETGREFPEIYDLRNRLSREWDFSLIVGRNEGEIARGMGPQKGLKTDCCTELKTYALQEVVVKNGFRALFLGDREDDRDLPTLDHPCSLRDERFPRSDENHPPETGNPFQAFGDEEETFRVHPIFHFSELDVWRYIKRESLPVLNLYFSREGKRYPSIRCVPCCSPIDSSAATLDEIIAEVRASKDSGNAGKAVGQKNRHPLGPFRAMG